MNLNGEKSRSRTILNGKPLYAYDFQKDRGQKRHRRFHQRAEKMSRTHIGTVDMRAKKPVSLNAKRNHVLAQVIAWLIVFIFVVLAMIFMF